MVASGAFVSRGHGDALPILRGDTNRLSAKAIANGGILIRIFDE